MYIKSVTIDGFKSYAQRTEINGFDYLFNAITGLNGSGKSNILDAICFLLGISNLSQVRASNLQDLVYKNGQAGINKATVSITFDNSAKEQSPLGMEAHNEITITRQIVIGGRNKYLINGVNAQNSRVSDLFRSVGLNVNNPHFLIMQGRVTKVMNMKPPEILSMIEEATGTSMYEAKKESAQKMIEKKESKLNQINQVLEEEIMPTLQKLRDDRTSYLEFQKVQREAERLTRLLIAYSFYVTEHTASKAEEELEKMNKNKENAEQNHQEILKQMEIMRGDLEKLEHDRDSATKQSLSQLETTLSDKQKVEAKAQSNLNHHRDAINTEKKKIRSLAKSKSENEAAIKKKEKQIEDMISFWEKLMEQSKQDAEAFNNARKQFQAVSAGFAAAGDGEESTWQGQLMQTKRSISELQSETKQAHMRLKHSKDELKHKTAEIKKTENAYKKDEAVLKQVEASYKKLEVELSKLNYKEGREEHLTRQKRDLTNRVIKLRDQVGQLYKQFPSLHFEYSDPERNWDRNRVKGLVAEITEVKDPSTATALEVVAGGRLYNVVVDTHVTGEKLLKHGKLQRRFTIIPLNKVSARSIPADVVQHAKRLVGPDNAHLALSLVGSDQDVFKAMEYVFGKTIVCDVMDNAKKVAFDPKVKTRTVTLDGELFDPSGTLTGGSQSRAAPVLAQLMKMKDVRDELKSSEAKLREVETELSQISSIAEKYRELKHHLQMKENECAMLKQRLQEGTHGQQLEEIDRLKSVIEESEKLLASSKDRENEMIAKCKELEKKIKNAPAEREKELKKAEKVMKDAGEKADKTQASADEKNSELEGIKLQKKELENEITEYTNQEEKAEKQLEEMQKQYDSLSQTLDECKNAVKVAKHELQKQREYIRMRDQDIQAKVGEMTEAQQKANSLEHDIKEQSYAIAKHVKESQEAANKIKQLLEEHDWIEHDRHLFGQKDSLYDFQASNPKELSRRLSKLKETKEKLSKSVNMRAMSLLGKVEEKCQDLLKRKRIIETDKTKIKQTIIELDQKKNEAVTKAYEQVNKDFGNIFSTLLPGATAKLGPPEGSSVLAGLEFRVGFGGVWKDNLSELSGGQRSLVALSLILAMLLLKPAPIYILDEVDAALDLSHTQNIGRMLREHFKKSQFIVVSLKDGMFNNANVLFRTKFVDGVSTVARFTQSSSSSAPGGRDPLASISVPGSTSVRSSKPGGRGNGGARGDGGARKKAKI